MTKHKRWLSFLGGLLAGTVLTLSILAAAVYFSGNKIWLLRVNTYDLTSNLRNVIMSMSEETLQEFIDGLKPRIPEVVKNKSNPQFGEIKFNLGGEEFTLPQELAERIEENYRSCLVRGIEEFLDSLPVEDMGIDLGNKAADIMENAVYTEYNSRLFHIAVVGILSLPLRLELLNKEGVQAFQLKLTGESSPRQ